MLFNVLSFLLAVSPLVTGQSTDVTSASSSHTASHSSTRSGSAASTTHTSSIITSTIPTTLNSTFSTLPASATSTAQFPTLSGLSTCVTNCLQLSIAQANCTMITDVNCFCGPGSARFENSTVTCVAQGCRDELTTAEGIAQKFCDLASTTLSFPTAPVFTTSTTSSSSQGTQTSASSSSGSASATTSTRANGAQKSSITLGPVLILITSTLLGGIYTFAS